MFNVGDKVIAKDYPTCYATRPEPDKKYTIRRIEITNLGSNDWLILHEEPESTWFDSRFFELAEDDDKPKRKYNVWIEDLIERQMPKKKKELSYEELAEEMSKPMTEKEMEEFLEIISKTTWRDWK